MLLYSNYLPQGQSFLIFLREGDVFSWDSSRFMQLLDYRPIARIA